MTCIVGLVDGGRVWIGADSLMHATCQRFPVTPLESKLVNRNGMLIGVTGPSRVIQLLEHILEMPEHPPNMGPYTYLVRLFVPALRALIVEHGGVKINDPSDGWEFLLGYRGGLYSICHDLSVTHLPEYGSVGCGHEVALGALHAMAFLSSSMMAVGIPMFGPHERVRLALEAAAENDIHVAPPFRVESIV